MDPRRRADAVFDYAFLTTGGPRVPIHGGAIAVARRRRRMRRGLEPRRNDAQRATISITVNYTGFREFRPGSARCGAVKRDGKRIASVAMRNRHAAEFWPGSARLIADALVNHGATTCCTTHSSSGIAIIAGYSRLRWHRRDRRRYREDSLLCFLDPVSGRSRLGPPNSRLVRSQSFARFLV